MVDVYKSVDLQQASRSQHVQPSENQDPKKDRRFKIVVYSITLIIFVKALIFAVLITPLWEIPDESGHYSYAESISRGVYPVLGETKMADDVTASWLSADTPPPLNWIAQHPPLFYVLDAPIIATARQIGLSFDAQVRAARILSAAFGALTFLGLANFLRYALKSNSLAVAGALFTVSTPMFIHLSSGVSHDTLVACTAAWCAFFSVKWMYGNSSFHLFISALLMAMCTVTKITSLAVAVPLYFMFCYLIARRHRFDEWKKSIVLAGGLWAAMFLPASIWIMHNFIVFGIPFPGSGVIYTERVYVQIGFFEYMFQSPFWQHTLINYIGLIGWTGLEHGKLNWFQISGPTATFFISIIFMTCVVRLISISKFIRPATWQIEAAYLLCGACVLWIGIRSTELDFAEICCTAIMIVVACTLARGLFDEWRKPGAGWLFLTASFCIIFFAFTYYYYLWSHYTGQIRATHGRYFYPVIPFFSLILLSPLVGRRRLEQASIIAATLAMVISDGYFLHKVLPFYGQL